jgi:hypothetical protein
VALRAGGGAVHSIITGREQTRHTGVQETASLDYIVGAGEQRWRHAEAERFGSFEIDDEFVLGRCLHRPISKCKKSLQAEAP